MRPRSILAFTILWCLMRGVATSQPSAPPAATAHPALQVETQTIHVVDPFERDYVVPREEAWIAARLAVNCDGQSPAAAHEKSLTAEGLDYPANQEDWSTANKFPVINGAAQVQLLDFTDAAKNPVYYDLALRLKDGRQLPLRNGLWQAGGASQTRLITTSRAPNQSWEWLALVGLLLSGAATVYWLMGRLLFVRLLRHGRLNVAQALGLSNTLVGLGWACLATSAVGLYAYPVVIWHQPYWAYIMAWGGYLIAMGAIYTVAAVLTRA